MLVLVINIMWKSLLFKVLDLTYADNLISCESILKCINIFCLIDILGIWL